MRIALAPRRQRGGQVLLEVDRVDRSVAQRIAVTGGGHSLVPQRGS
jgi:hypothetical protein